MLAAPSPAGHEPSLRGGGSIRRDHSRCQRIRFCFCLLNRNISIEMIQPKVSKLMGAKKLGNFWPHSPPRRGIVINDRLSAEIMSHPRDSRQTPPWNLGDLGVRLFQVKLTSQCRQDNDSDWSTHLHFNSPSAKKVNRWSKYVLPSANSRNAIQGKCIN